MCSTASNRRTPPATATRSGSGSVPRSGPMYTAGPARETRPGRRAGAPGRGTHPYGQRGVRGDVHGRRTRRGGRWRERRPRMSGGRAAGGAARSRYAHAIRTGVELARAEPDFDTVVDRLHAAYAATHHWVHVLPNAALLAAALTHADGDFSRSIGCAVSGGWDTDSNGATAGSLAGLLAGRPSAIPDRWTAPLKNRLATSVHGFDSIGFDALAELTHQEARRP
ncbi:ADP-ribosylglycohydrolase family protein [Streptomyces sp. M10(2022)]